MTVTVTVRIISKVIAIMIASQTVIVIVIEIVTMIVMITMRGDNVQKTRIQDKQAILVNSDHVTLSGLRQSIVSFI